MNMDRNDIMLMYGFIAIRLFLLYLSTNVSSNIMNQIYTERVLINGEQPPKLVYQIYLFLVVDIIFNIFLVAFVWGILNLSGKSNTNLLNMFVMHYIITLVIIFIILIIITHTMYIKKYFLYQDDGLRAIRALNDLMMNIGLFVSIIPVFLIADSSNPVVNSIMNTNKNNAVKNNSVKNNAGNNNAQK